MGFWSPINPKQTNSPDFHPSSDILGGGHRWQGDDSGEGARDVFCDELDLSATHPSARVQQWRWDFFGETNIFFVFRFGNNICCWDFVVKNRVGPIWCFFFFSQDFLPGSINFRRKMASSSRKGMDFEGFGPRILRHRHRQWKLIARSNPPKMTQTPSIYSWHCPHAAITDRWEGRSLADRGKTGEKKWGVGKNLE